MGRGGEREGDMRGEGGEEWGGVGPGEGGDPEGKNEGGRIIIVLWYTVEAGY